MGAYDSFMDSPGDVPAFATGTGLDSASSGFLGTGLSGGQLGALGGLAGVGGLAAYQMFGRNGDQLPAAAGPMQDIGWNQLKNGLNLEQPLLTGKLPDQWARQVQAMENSWDATSRSNFGVQQGGTADPSHSTQLASMLADNQTRALMASNNIAQQMYQSGIQSVGIANNDFMALAKMQSDQTNAESSAISNFASALGLAGVGMAKAFPLALA